MHDARTTPPTVRRVRQEADRLRPRLGLATPGLGAYLSRMLPNEAWDRNARSRRRLPPSETDRLVVRAEGLAIRRGHVLDEWQHEEFGDGRFAWCLNCHLAVGIDIHDEYEKLYGSVIAVKCGEPPTWT